MDSVKVKICGITCERDLQATTAAGADAVGFVVDVPSSPRNLPWTVARRLVARVPSSTLSVLVTVPTDLTSLVEACRAVGPDATQLHGAADLDYRALRTALSSTKLIQAIHVHRTGPLPRFPPAFDAFLVDTYVEGSHGGTGRTHDWRLSRTLRQSCPKPFILAGGLTPENVVEAIRVVQPHAVDVSSGVENAAGRKDSGKVRRFVEQARTVNE
jgi:phosphoribosylanthranilate isomerase